MTFSALGLLLASFAVGYMYTVPQGLLVFGLGFYVLGIFNEFAEIAIKRIETP
jgi:hypothetical protein